MIDRLQVSSSFYVRLLCLLMTVVSAVQILLSSWNFHVTHHTRHHRGMEDFITTTPSTTRQPPTMDRASTLQLETTTTTVMTETTMPHSYSSSRVTAVSPGMVQYDNVCVYSQQIVEHRPRQGVDVTRRQLRLKAFGNKDESLRIDDAVYKQYKPNPGNYDLFLQPDVVPAAEMEALVDDDWITQPTLFTMQLHHNPGHCLSDMVFSLAWDDWERHSNNNNNNNTQTASSSSRHYDSFVYGTWNKMWHNKYQPDWCFELLRHAGFITPETGMVRPRQEAGQVCFRQLLVPLFGLHRFPLDTTDEASVQAFQKVSVMKNFQTNDLTMQYPVQALEALRTSLCKSLQLSFAPWPVSSWAEIATMPKILLYNRRGSPRRHWVNAEQVQALLQEKYLAQVEMLGEAWEDMTPTEQLALYNEYAYILTVHGAHEANLIATRPGTRVVEVQCLHPNDPRPKESLTTQPAHDPVGWYGPPSWFSAFSRRLGAQHFVYGEYKGCSSSSSSTAGQAGLHGSANIRVDADRLVAFVAGRFGLQARNPNHEQS